MKGQFQFLSRRVDTLTYARGQKERERTRTVLRQGGDGAKERMDEF